MVDVQQCDIESLGYASSSARVDRPLTFPYILIAVFDLMLLLIALSAVPDYCLTRYQTWCFSLAAGASGLLSLSCVVSRSIHLRFAVLLITPAALWGSWLWALNQWAGGDDGPGFAWGLVVGGATLVHSFLLFALFITQLIYFANPRKNG